METQKSYSTKTFAKTDVGHRFIDIRLWSRPTAAILLMRTGDPMESIAIRSHRSFSSQHAAALHFCAAVEYLNRVYITVTQVSVADKKTLSRVRPLATNTSNTGGSHARTGGFTRPTPKNIVRIILDNLRQVDVVCLAGGIQNIVYT